MFFQKTLLEKTTNDIGTFPVLVYFFPPPSTRKTLQLCWNCFSSCVKVIKIYSFTIPARTYECRLGHNQLKADTEYVTCVLLQKAVLPEICKKLLKSFKSSMKSVFIVKINNSKGSSLKHQLTQQTMLATLASLFTFRYPCALRLNYFAHTHTPTPRVCHLSSVRNEKSFFFTFPQTYPFLHERRNWGREGTYLPEETPQRREGTLEPASHSTVLGGKCKNRVSQQLATAPEVSGWESWFHDVFIVNAISTVQCVFSSATLWARRCGGMTMSRHWVLSHVIALKSIV